MPRPRPSVEAKPLFPYIVRRIEVVRGTVPLRMECYPAFNYCRDPHQTTLINDDLVDGFSGQKKVHFKSKNLDLELRWFVEAGETEKAPNLDVVIDRQSADRGLLGPGVYSDFSLQESQVITFVLGELSNCREVPAAKPSIGDSGHAEPTHKYPESFIYTEPIKLTTKFCLSLLNDTKI
jgi:hypothetical protein